eukprot:4351221-Pleurochrysis_carterae.AAC.2
MVGRARVASRHQCSRRGGNVQVYWRCVGPILWTGRPSGRVGGLRERECGFSTRVPVAGTLNPWRVDGETGEESPRGIGQKVIGA